MTSPLIILGVIGAPHGVKGEVRVKSSTADPLGIGGYGPVTLPDGRRLKIKSVRQGSDYPIFGIGVKRKLYPIFGVQV